MIDVEQLTQTIQIAVERCFRDIAFGVGPQQRGQHCGVDVAPAVRDQRLQELQRLLLRLALRNQRLAVATNDEFAQRANRYRPRPLRRVGRRRRQLPFADQVAYEFALDSVFECRCEQRRHHLR